MPTQTAAVQTDGGAMTKATLDAMTSGLNFSKQSVSDSLTAHAGGGQTNALPLTSGINRVATVATAGDSVALPPSYVGAELVVINAGANAMQVFGNGTETINSVATATGVSQGAGRIVVYYCVALGNWQTNLAGTAGLSLTAVTASGAINPHTSGVYVITKAGVAAMTLAAPTAGVDDGVEIELFSSTAFAHTLTATGLLQTASANVNVATFSASAGGGLRLIAFNAKWIAVSQIGITFS